MTDILKISESSSLALHAMALLARNQEQRLSTTRFAELFDASEHTLAKVMHGLVRAGLVDSVRGANGGFALLKHPRDISMLEIHEAVDGPMRQQHCLLGKPACDGQHCAMQEFIGKLHQKLHGYFSRTTLEELARHITITKTIPGAEACPKRRKAREV